MCLIMFIPKGRTVPEAYIYNAFRYNSDGAGFMIQSGGKVYIRKGFMSVAALLSALESEDIPRDLVIHFRQATHGDVCPELCHPFPLSRNIADLKAVEVVCSRAVAHNGIIAIPHAKGESDTMAFIRKILAYRSVYSKLDSPPIKLLLEKMLGRSKLAVMFPDHVTLTGAGWHKNGGVYFSNDSYERNYYLYNYDLSNTEEPNDLECPYCRAALTWDAADMYFCSVCKTTFTIDADGVLSDIYDLEDDRICPECGRYLWKSAESGVFFCAGCSEFYTLEEIRKKEGVIPF